ncbi:unnamed protein product, partial [[Candida] boidinii]
MINYARACAEDGSSDTGPYNHDCLCAQDSDFQSLVASCLDCGWCLWDNYSSFLTAPLSECSLPTEPTGTACAPCPSESGASSVISATSSVAVSTNVPSSVISSILASASASASDSASASASGYSIIPSSFYTIVPTNSFNTSVSATVSSSVATGIPTMTGYIQSGLPFFNVHIPSDVPSFNSFELASPADGDF